MPSSGGHERLVDAAWHVLERTGFEGFKVASVIRAAGVSTKTFYRFFASKDELLIELLRDETRRGAARIERLVGDANAPGLRVRAWIEASMSAAAHPELRARAQLFSGLSQRVQQHPDVFAEIRGQLIAPLVSAIEDGVRVGELVSADPVADARRIQDMCRSAVLDIVTGDGGEEPSGIIASIQGFALRALAVPPSASRRG